MMTRTALVMAGGTGGHIFPGLAVAEALRQRGWRVHWLGAPEQHGESQLVPPRGFRFEPHRLRRRARQGPEDAGAAAAAPAQGLLAEHRVVRRVKPDVVVGLGGYITFPGGMMSVLLGKPLVLHEQNSVAGMANKVLAGVADRVFTAFPKRAEEGAVGRQSAARSLPRSPIRPALRRPQRPAEAAGGGRQPGRQGAQRAPCRRRWRASRAASARIVLHQSGAKQIDELRANYAAAGVRPSSRPSSTTRPGLRRGRPGDLPRRRQHRHRNRRRRRSALFVPFPSAVDDHQTTNARFLVDAGGGWLVQQATSPLNCWPFATETSSAPRCSQGALKAKKMQKTEAATEASGRACEELAK
jgi:UDP-N-acetylglucosamine--N-acetylmuramyl-(pentapeptide) pyrophosphoryl-undecaprenol N-acetylglucosamine transferase